MAATFASIDDYIDQAAELARPALVRIRAIAHEVVPGAGEDIKYAMPTITLDGRSLVHFAAWRSHVALYPQPEGDEQFEAAIAPYGSGKGAVRFALSEPLPWDLIRQLIDLLHRQHARPRRAAAPDSPSDTSA